MKKENKEKQEIPVRTKMETGTMVPKRSTRRNNDPLGSFKEKKVSELISGLNPVQVDLIDKTPLFVFQIKGIR